MGSLNLTKTKILVICLVVFAVAVAAVTIFGVPFGNVLFFGVFLACPLMHVFMMNGHGGHDQEGKKLEGQTDKSCH